MDGPHTGSTHLLVDLDGLLVLLQLSTVSSHLQQTLVGRTKETTTHLVNYKSYIFGVCDVHYSTVQFSRMWDKKMKWWIKNGAELWAQQMFRLVMVGKANGEANNINNGSVLYRSPSESWWCDQDQETETATGNLNQPSLTLLVSPVTCQNVFCENGPIVQSTALDSHWGSAKLFKSTFQKRLRYLIQTYLK